MIALLKIQSKMGVIMGFGFDNSKLKGKGPFCHVNTDTTLVNTIVYKKKEYNFDAMDVSLRKHFGLINPIKGTVRKPGSFISR